MPNTQLRDTTVSPVRRARTRKEAEALICRLDADREAIMHGRTFTDRDYSVAVLRQMREERMARPIAQ